MTYERPVTAPSTDALEEVERLRAENDRLKERVTELEQLLPENGRWFSAEVVEAYVAEMARLRRALGTVWSLLTRNEPTHVWEGMAQTMRELGVEVDG